MKRKKSKSATFNLKDTYRRSEMEFGVAADAYRSESGKKATRNGAVIIRIVLAIIISFVTAGVWLCVVGKMTLACIVVSAVLGLLTFSSIHVCMEWERAVVMRLGRFHKLSGPGFFFIIPLLEFCPLTVDQRTIVTPFGAEEALTSDLVPLDVDAVLQWMIWDPEKACSEVEDCYFAVALTAQTALRNAIGRATLSNVVMRRQQLDQELREAVEEKVTDWGVAVLSVEIRDIIVPKELQNALSLEAQSNILRNARVTLMEAEGDISDILHKASTTYRDDEIALALRKMHLIHEGIQYSGGSMVVPSAYTEGFADKSREE